MKKNILALAVTSILSANAYADINDILITEYIEPASGSNKAIEISNLSSTDHQFTADTYITKQVNGKPTSWALSLDSAKASNLAGVTIKAGESIVLLSSSADSDLKTQLIDNGVTVISSSIFNHNGNDALAIVSVPDTTSMDKYGNIDGSKITSIYDIVGNKDDSSVWGSDVTLRRKVAITTPKDTYDATDWNSSTNTSDTLFNNGLGKKPADDPAPGALPLTPTPPATDEVCGTATDNPRTTIEAIQGSSDPDSASAYLAYARSPLATVYKGKTGSDGVQYQSNYESADVLYVEGVVSAVAKYPIKGFYLYQATNNDPLSSDGIFVETKSSSVTDDLVGRTVCVASKVYEKYNLTKLQTDKWDLVGTDDNDPTPVELKVLAEDNGSFANTLERHEGMLVRFADNLNSDPSGDVEEIRVSKTFSFDYDYFRHNMIMSYKRTNVHPNQKHPAGSVNSQNVLKQNADYSFYVEGNVAYSDVNDVDHFTNSAGTKVPASDNIPFYSSFNSQPSTNYIRVNDTVKGLEGIVTYHSGYNKPASFFLIAPNEDISGLEFVHNTKRTTAKELKEELFAQGSVELKDIEVKVATQNVLNYFNSPFGGDQNNHGDNRGANTYEEYEDQKAKIVAAIRGLDADILGLMEIENNGFGEESAIAELVNEINLYYDEPKLSKKNLDKSTSNRYAFIGFDKNGDSVIDGDDSIGSDSITTGLLYRPERVSLDAVKIIPMPSQHDGKAVVNQNGVIVKNYTDAVLESGDNYQRDSLAATFIVNKTGKKLTVAVNHFKSKGSTCAEDWDGINLGTKEKLKFNEDKAILKQTNGDYQASCENFRVAAAVQLGNELDKIGGDRVVLGDMNSYAQEDPMLVLTTNPTGKIIKAARNTFIGRDPQFGPEGKIITKTYGYLNAVSMKDPEGWSYSFGSEIGSLDHVLITDSLKNRLKAATDWHINAAESPLYDYNRDKKGTSDDSENTFVQKDAFRSSDHDSAIIVLSYKNAETEGNPIHVAIEGGIAGIPYVIPAAAGVKEDDIANISISPRESGLDMSNVIISPTVIGDSKYYDSLGKYKYLLNDQPTMRIAGLKPGLYSVSMNLTRDGKSVANSMVNLDIEVAKTDSLKPTIKLAESDGSGGSFSLFGILSLLGLGFLRKKS